MKRISLFILTLFALFFANIAYAQVAPQTWIFQAGTIKPANSSWTETLPYLGGMGSGCVSVNNSGLLGFTSCSGGGGGGSGNVATSSAETANDVPYWTSTNGTPATLSGGVSSFQWNPSTVTLTATEASTTNIGVTGTEYFGTNNITSISGFFNFTAGSQFSWSTGAHALTWDGTNLLDPPAGTGNIGTSASPWFGIFGTNSTTTSQYITGITSKYLATDANGQVIGVTGAASSTLLSDNNTFSGTDSFTKLLALTYASSTALSASGTIFANNFYDTSAAGSSCIGDSSGILENGNCVSSLASAGGSLTISSPTGNVDASLNLANQNMWSALQLFSNASSTVFSDFGTGYFGGTSTTTIQGNGATSTFAGPVNIATGTGCFSEGSSKCIDQLVTGNTLLSGDSEFVSAYATSTAIGYNILYTVPAGDSADVFLADTFNKTAGTILTQTSRLSGGSYQYLNGIGTVLTGGFGAELPDSIILTSGQSLVASSSAAGLSYFTKIMQFNPAPSTFFTASTTVGTAYTLTPIYTVPAGYNAYPSAWNLGTSDQTACYNNTNSSVGIAQYDAPNGATPFLTDATSTINANSINTIAGVPWSLSSGDAIDLYSNTTVAGIFCWVTIQQLPN